jgi:hypothetical protein
MTSPNALCTHAPEAETETCGLNYESESLKTCEPTIDHQELITDNCELRTVELWNCDAYRLLISARISGSDQSWAPTNLLRIMPLRSIR